MKRKLVTVDGNMAATNVAFKVSEVIAIYPITPASTMGELVDEWASNGQKNLWNIIPRVQEMQSEGGVAGVVHGALLSGSLATTFTASQGLLLMIPNMYKIAGELTPAVIHVAARSIATHALSIFGDQSDVMAARMTGFAFLTSNSVQEAQDMALIAHSATLESRIPFVHFFDGFRTSHEVSKIEQLTDDDIRSMINYDRILEHRQRAVSPDHPELKGSSQNPDVFFQSREAVNKFYQDCPQIVQDAMDEFGKMTGRQYKLFDYYGPKDAERVIVIMGSGAQACQTTVDHLVEDGEKVGVLNVRLFRPFANEFLVEALPKTTKSIAVLDRTKEPGGAGEPLYLDVLQAIYAPSQVKKFDQPPIVIGGRYGLSSKEFNPAMVKAIYDELKKDEPMNSFSVGIEDDVTHKSLRIDESFILEDLDGVRAIFYGLGSDGTVGANKNSIKIIGENTDNHAQGYFVYDSKKAGSITISHLRFGEKEIHMPYLIEQASFVACHGFQFVERFDVLEKLEEGGVFLLNAPYPKSQVWDKLPKSIQQEMIEKKVKFYVIDAYKVAKHSDLGRRINTIMQTCFFAISGVLPKDEAIVAIKDAIKKAYGKKGEKVVQKNFAAVDHTLENLHQVEFTSEITSKIDKMPAVPATAPEFVQKVVGRMLELKGDTLPVSALPVDGSFPVGTAAWEKRNLTLEIPVWEEDMCIQCGKCIAICPHAVIRTKVYDAKCLEKAPQTFKASDAKDRDLKGGKYTIQIAPEDCTGCSLCVEICPVKSKTDPDFKALNMRDQLPIKETEKENWDFFQGITSIDRLKVNQTTLRGIQFLKPLFEFSGACAGCGETPYIKLLTQLFGDRILVANATGCSSIFGGNLPTTPWTKNKKGRGPGWANSLFEDNAEFGLGFKLSIDQQELFALQLIKQLEPEIGTDLVKDLVEAEQRDEADIFNQRERVDILKEKLKTIDAPEVKQLKGVVDALVRKDVWIIGGDGWAYDIGFGGLDHILASGENVNILVLDTEVYSNTGGQQSKSTPRAAVAKFASAGKSLPKKDLARIAMSYGHVYVATVAIGAKDEHTLKCILEAQKYEGTSLIIAYSSCIAQGIDLTKDFLTGHKLAVSSGYWPLYRYNPALIVEGENPFSLDCPKPKISFEEYAKTENRFRVLQQSDPKRAKMLIELAQKDIDDRWMYLEGLKAWTTPEKIKETVKIP